MASAAVQRANGLVQIFRIIHSFKQNYQTEHFGVQTDFGHKEASAFKTDTKIWQPREKTLNPKIHNDFAPLSTYFTNE
jgi:hypothetical protein